MKSLLNSILLILVISGMSLGVYAQDLPVNNAWLHIDSDRFTVYYSDGRQELAEEVLYFLESEYIRITEFIGYPPGTTLHVVLLQPDRDPDTAEPQEIIKSSGNKGIIVPADVMNAGLKQDLSFRFSEAVINEMLYGPGLEQLFEDGLNQFPEWFVTGAARFAANGPGETMDSYVKDNLSKITYDKPDRLKGEKALLAGQSFWNYMTKEYGESCMANVMNYTRIIRNEEKAIQITTGISYDLVMQNWQNFYMVNGNEVNEEK